MADKPSTPKIRVGLAGWSYKDWIGIVYPDIVVWEPNGSGSAAGKAHVIEEIETDDSVNDQEAAQWSDYGSLGISTFNLVVPVSRKNDALEIIRRKGITGVTRVQGYCVRNGRIEFEL